MIEKEVLMPSASYLWTLFKELTLVTPELQWLWLQRVMFCGTVL